MTRRVAGHGGRPLPPSLASPPVCPDGAQAETQHPHPLFYRGYKASHVVCVTLWASCLRVSSRTACCRACLRASPIEAGVDSRMCTVGTPLHLGVDATASGAGRARIRGGREASAWVTTEFLSMVTAGGPPSLDGTSHIHPRPDVDVYDHTRQRAPEPFSTRKLSCRGSGQYWGGGPPGKPACCTLFWVRLHPPRRPPRPTRPPAEGRGHLFAHRCVTFFCDENAFQLARHPPRFTRFDAGAREPPAATCPLAVIPVRAWPLKVYFACHVQHTLHHLHERRHWTPGGGGIPRPGGSRR